MAHRSPFTQEVVDEWRRLIDEVDREKFGEREPPPELVEGWRRLHERAYRGGQWVVNPYDASLVASLGWDIAFRQFRYADAARLAGQFHEHPEAESDDVSWCHLAVKAAGSWILAGEVERGLARFREVLSRTGYGHQSRVHQVRDWLMVVLDERPRDEPLDGRLAHFVASLLWDWKGRKTKASRASTCETAGDLLALLETT